jgi:hypothetical protein
MNPATQEEWNKLKPLPPEYRWVGVIGRQSHIGSCDICGSAVFEKDQKIHTEWHEETSLRHWIAAYVLEKLDASIPRRML